LSATALQGVTTALHDWITERSIIDTRLGRPVGPLEASDRKRIKESLQAMIQLRPLGEAINRAMPEVSVAADPAREKDKQIRVSTLQSLEDVAAVLGRLRSLETIVPDPILSDLLKEIGVPSPEKPEEKRDDKPDTKGGPHTKLGAELQESLKKALPVIRRAVSDPDVDVRLLALDALDSLGPLAVEAVPELTKAAGDPDRFVRWNAVRTLGRLAPLKDDQASAAVKSLIPVLRDEDVDVKTAAANAIEAFGSQAKDAVPALGAAVKT